MRTKPLNFWSVGRGRSSRTSDCFVISKENKAAGVITLSTLTGAVSMETKRPHTHKIPRFNIGTGGDIDIGRSRTN